MCGGMESTCDTMNDVQGKALNHKSVTSGWPLERITCKASGTMSDLPSVSILLTPTISSSWQIKHNKFNTCDKNGLRG